MYFIIKLRFNKLQKIWNSFFFIDKIKKNQLAYGCHCSYNMILILHIKSFFFHCLLIVKNMFNDVFYFFYLKNIFVVYHWRHSPLDFCVNSL